MAILVIPVIEAETDQGTGFFPFLNTKLPAHPSLGIGVGIFGAKIVKVEYVLFVADFFACHANQDVVRPFFPSLFDDSCLNFPARYWCSGGCNEVGKSLTGIWYRIFLKTDFNTLCRWKIDPRVGCCVGEAARKR